LIAGAWLIVLVVAPALPAVAAAAAYGFGSLICHQRPERSFHLGSAQLPVCARCIGIYAGAAAGAVLAALAPRGGWDDAVRAPRTVLALAAVPTAMTLTVEWSGLADPGNMWRALSGVLLGAGVAAVVLTLHYDECAPRRPIASSQPPPRI
jgi:uncharacterized membrane protein